jgi:hypothetical protein
LRQKIEISADTGELPFFLIGAVRQLIMHQIVCPIPTTPLGANQRLPHRSTCLQ